MGQKGGVFKDISVKGGGVSQCRTGSIWGREASAWAANVYLSSIAVPGQHFATERVQKQGLTDKQEVTYLPSPPHAEFGVITTSRQLSVSVLYT